MLPNPFNNQEVNVINLNIRIDNNAKKRYASLAAISMALLLSAVLIVPTLSAYADHDNGNGKSQDNKKHQKDRKGEGPKDPERCKHGASAKYNKHCER